MKKYGLLGAKLSHSYSPIIHQEIMKDMGIDGSYELLECEENELKEYIDKIKKGEFSGYNVTIPYKKQIIKYLDELSFEAKKIGSVNTISLIDNKVVGFNTDYYGFYQELLHFNIDVLNKKCYVLGNGGASLAVRQVLIDMGGDVTVVSRNPSNGMLSYDDLKNENIDILVNTTPVGMFPNVDASPLDESIVKKAKFVIDIIFNPRVTKFLSYANSNMDGLYMLVGQAIKAEEIWQKKEYGEDLFKLVNRIEAIICE